MLLKTCGADSGRCVCEETGSSPKRQHKDKLHDPEFEETKVSGRREKRRQKKRQRKDKGHHLAVAAKS